MVDDVLLNKAAAIERAVRRAREEYAGDATNLRENQTRQDAILLNLDIVQRILDEHVEDFPGVQPLPAPRVAGSNAPRTRVPRPNPKPVRSSDPGGRRADQASEAIRWRSSCSRSWGASFSSTSGANWARM